LKAYWSVYDGGFGNKKVFCVDIEDDELRECETEEEKEELVNLRIQDSFKQEIDWVLVKTEPEL